MPAIRSFLSQNVIPGACAGVRDVSALGVEAPCGSVFGRGANRGFGLDGINDGRRCRREQYRSN